MSPVQQAWESFAAAAIPPQATAVQRAVMRDAFFAGATYLLQGMLSAAIDEASMSRFFEQASADLECFGRELRRRAAESWR